MIEKEEKGDHAATVSRTLEVDDLTQVEQFGLMSPNFNLSRVFSFR